VSPAIPGVRIRCGSRRVTAQAFEALAVASGHSHVGVQAYAAKTCTALASRCRKLLDIDSVAETQHGLAGARPCRDASADGGGVERGESRLVMSDRIDLISIVARSQQEKGTSRSQPQASQWTRRNPWARIPHFRKRRNYRSTKRGGG